MSDVGGMKSVAGLPAERGAAGVQSDRLSDLVRYVASGHDDRHGSLLCFLVLSFCCTCLHSAQFRLRLDGLRLLRLTRD